MAENNGRKLFYTIGEMSKLAQVEPYILRYWESEFDLLHPEKRKNGQRMFKEKDLEIILEIKELLYNQKYTIAGAKKKLIENRKNSKSREELFQSDPEHYKNFLLKLKKELEELNDLLDAKGSSG